MLPWLLLGFALGAIAGGGGAWFWLTRQPVPASRAATGAPVLEAPAAMDDLSQTAQRFLNDLERKYEGIGSAGPEAPAPKRRRKRSAPPGDS